MILRSPHGASALYRCPTVSYPWLRDIEAEQEAARWEWLARRAQADLSIYRVHRAFDAEHYTDRAAALLDHRTGDSKAWRRLLAGHERKLSEAHAYAPEVYIEISLTSRAADRDGLELPAAVRRAMRALKPGGGSSEKDLLEREAQIRQMVTELLPVRPPTLREVQWLFARSETRGLSEPVLDEHWRPAGILNTEKLHKRFARASVYERNRALVVEGDDQTTLQALLALGERPDRMEFPDAAEILYRIDSRLERPVDSVIHVTWTPNPEALTRIRGRVRDVDISLAEATADGSQVQDERLTADQHLARDIQALLQDPSMPPALEVSIGLATAEMGREQLKDRVKAIGRAAGQVQVNWPRNLQKLLWEDHLPGAAGRHVKDFEHPIIPVHFGTLMPHATHETGSGRGVYIARVVADSHLHSTRVRWPVLVDITAPAAAGRPPAWFMSGGLGSGKTITAELLAFHAAMRGSRVVTVDPKGDHKLERITELEGKVQVIAPSGEDESQRGLLDPLVISPPGIREDRTISYYSDLLDRPSIQWSTQVRIYLKEELALARQPCGLRVLQRLLKSRSEHARDAGTALRMHAESGIASLGFGDGTVSLSREAQVTTIRPTSLDLPQPDVPRANYSEFERLSATTLKLIAAFALRILGGDSSLHKLFLFDEAGVIVNSPDGLRLVAEINLYGRTNNATLLLLAQLASMVGELEKLVGTRVIFGQETDQEAVRGLQLLGMDHENRALVQKVRGFRAGRGFLRDVDGRIAEIQVDPVYPKLLQVLNTNPDLAPVPA